MSYCRILLPNSSLEEHINWALICSSIRTLDPASQTSQAQSPKPHVGPELIEYSVGCMSCRLCKNYLWALRASY